MGKKFDWDEWVELAVFNYNTSVNEGTKHTTIELVYGKIARTPSCDPLMDDDQLPRYDDYMIKLVTLLHEIQRTARSNLIRLNYDHKSTMIAKQNIPNFIKSVELRLLRPLY